MNSTELKACPFCGEPGETIETHAGHFHIECSNSFCGARQHWPEQSPLAAVTSWNERAGDRKPSTLGVEAQKALASATGSALTDAEKIQKTIELLEYLHAECLVPDMAHDAIGTCRICRLLKELKAPNDELCRVRKTEK